MIILSSIRGPEPQ